MNTASLVQRAAGLATGFRTIGVLGLGLMGHGIAEVTAASSAGYTVIGVETSPEAAARGLETIRASLRAGAKRSVAKGVATAGDADAHVERVLSRLSVSSDKGALLAADIVIEAAPEDRAFKTGLYRELRGILRADAAVASNTSGLLIRELATAFGDPTRVIGLQ